MIKEIIIKVDNQAIHLSPELAIPIDFTNIPIKDCKFSTKSDLFWKVELLEFNSDRKCWKMKVIDYSVKDNSDFNRQKSTREVERIEFEKFDWDLFGPQLSVYQKSKLLNIIENHEINVTFREESNQKSGRDLLQQIGEFNFFKENNLTSEFGFSNPNPIIKTYEIEFKVYFSDANFMLGNVAFSKNIKEVDLMIDFEIKNEYILPEFENIKLWFAKKLKTKMFKVDAIITTTGWEVTKVIATSPEIEMIDAELVDNIKFQRTIALTKPPRKSDTIKSLFKLEEIFGMLDTDHIEGNVFEQDEQDILRVLLDKSKTRNRNQLEYLAGTMQSETRKLRFTLNPNFGFLFFIEGNEKNHFVWELLNSHATYIWSLDKSGQEIEFQYKMIEESVKTIRDIGREQYKSKYRQNDQNIGFEFWVIDHDKINSDFTAAFVKWKSNLIEKII